MGPKRGGFKPKFGVTPVGDEDDLRKFFKKIKALYAPKVNDSQSLEWKFWKSGNMKHPIVPFFGKNQVASLHM